jgi:hypothetical protein
VVAGELLVDVEARDRLTSQAKVHTAGLEGGGGGQGQGIQVASSLEKAGSRFSLGASRKK